MRRQFLLFTTASVLVLGYAAIAFGQKVAFRTVKGEPSRYITFPGNCEPGLNSSSQKMTDHTIFTLTDKNGGKIESGDSVRIECGAKFWRAEGGVDLAEGVPDNAADFIIEREGKFIRIKTADGRFVNAPTDGGGLTLSNKKESEGVFELLSNPKVN